VAQIGKPIFFVSEICCIKLLIKIKKMKSAIQSKATSVLKSALNTDNQLEAKTLKHNTAKMKSRLFISCKQKTIPKNEISRTTVKEAIADTLEKVSEVSTIKTEQNNSVKRFGINPKKPNANYVFCSRQHLAQRQQAIRLSILTKRTIEKANQAARLIKALTQYAVSTLCPTNYFHPETLKVYQARIAAHFTERNNHKIIFFKMLGLIYHIHELQSIKGYDTVLKSNEWLSFLEIKHFSKRTFQLNQIFSDEGLIQKHEASVKLLSECIFSFTLNASDANFYGLVGLLKHHGDAHALQAFYTAAIYQRYFY
jgi:hypothetical protein